MKCIYTVFYKKLKNYDGNDINSELRLKLLEYCLKSYRMCNPNTDVIIEYVDDVIENSTTMYFDKMMRIKNLNKFFDILWVDGDTLCLENLDGIITGEKMRGTFWGWWDGLNFLNGGVIYYPRNFLYNNWDFFSMCWIKMLSKMNDAAIKFTGPQEQDPITSLFLSQFSKGSNYENYSIYNFFEQLLEQKYLFDFEVNQNPLINNRMTRHGSYNNLTNTILQKKILHLNISGYNFNNFANFVVDNLIGYTHDKNLLIKRCDELGASNRYVKYELNNCGIKIINNSKSTLKFHLFDNEDLYTKNSSNGLIKENSEFETDIEQFKNAKKVVIMNILSGEMILLDANSK